MEEDAANNTRHRGRNWLLGCAVVVFIVIGAPLLWLVATWPRPTNDAALLRQVRTEVLAFAEANPNIEWLRASERPLPPALATLKPEHVSFDEGGVTLYTKPYFDGGWGYLITYSDDARPEPEGRYSKLQPGVYWFHPY